MIKVDEVIERAKHRYMHDPMFHSRVYVALRAIPDGEPTLLAAVALQMADTDPTEIWP